MYVDIRWVLTFVSLAFLHAATGGGFVSGIAIALAQTFLLCQALSSKPVITNHA